MKDNIRTLFINKRNNLTAKEVSYKSDKITNKLLELKEYKDAKVILCYMAVNNEVKTIKIMQKALLDGKMVALPKVENSTQMSFHVIKSFSDLKKGYKNIPEPKDNLLDISLIKESLLIVPGTVFNKQGYRMGYGKGYYDRFIRNYKPLVKIGLAYDILLSDDIIINEYDEKLDIIITEDNIYK